MNLQAEWQHISIFLNNLPQTIKNSPQDEQIAYYTIFAGIFLFIVGLFVKLLF